MRAITERRELSSIAYGFIASKALFAALGVGPFTHLASGPRTTAELSHDTGIAASPLQTLLHALSAVGLIVAEGHSYTNAPACQRYLAQGAPDEFGEYFRLQLGQQIYPALLQLDAGLTGTGAASDTFADLLSRPDEARTFTAAQHAGSRGAAHVLAKRTPLGGARTMLDVGGGSGALSIALCTRNPRLRAAVLDFPAVIDVARTYIDEAGLGARIDLLSGDAVHTPWPADQDVVLLSYLLSALGATEIDMVLAKAYTSLAAGGLLIVHDFMIHDDASGPASAALWFLQYLAFRGDGISFSAGALSGRLRHHGFTPAETEVLIPDTTKTILARKASP
ncbi:MAG: methyltransferase [Pseudonocardiales bacterium]|nr:MAG: methyltransferase [Pseudonocardiales bacterium]